MTMNEYQNEAMRTASGMCGSCEDITVNCQNCFEIIHNISSYKNRVLINTRKQALGVYLGSDSQPY